MCANNLLRKMGLKLHKKKYFEFSSIPSSFFIVRVFIVIIEILDSCKSVVNSKNFFDMIIYTDRFSRVLSKSNAFRILNL